MLAKQESLELVETLLLPEGLHPVGVFPVGLYPVGVLPVGSDEGRE
jgi:hypothetical protein